MPKDLRVTLGIPIVRSKCVLRTDRGIRESVIYLDLFFSKWAIDLEDFVPLLVPESNGSDNGRYAFHKLEPMVSPEEFVEKLMSSYHRYAERVSDLREGMTQLRKSYRFTLFLPVSTSQLEAENRLVKELGIVEGALRGINLLLGVEEGERILDMEVVSVGEQLMLEDELRLGKEIKYYRYGLGESTLLRDLITTNPRLFDYLRSLIC